MVVKKEEGGLVWGWVGFLGFWLGEGFVGWGVLGGGGCLLCGVVGAGLVFSQEEISEPMAPRWLPP